MNNEEWDYQIGQLVYVDLAEEYGESGDTVFIVIERFVEDEIQIYNVKSTDTLKQYEAYPIMILDTQAFEKRKKERKQYVKKHHFKLIGSEMKRLKKNTQNNNELLAQKAGITNPSISRYEKEVSIPNIQVLINLLEIFNSEIEDCNEKYMEVIPEEMKRIRETRKLSIEELAKKTKLSVSYLTRMENTKTAIDLEFLIRILKELL